MAETSPDAAESGPRDGQTDAPTRAPSEGSVTSVKVLVPGEHSMVSLLGTQDELLKLIEAAFSTAIHVRGNEIAVSGRPAEVDLVAHLFEELVILLERGQTIDRGLVRQTIRMVRDSGPERPSQVLSEALLTHRGRTIRPKSLGQKRYLDAIKKNTVTFGIGPAGTGKTYLAMGAAVQALREKQVNRLILTRPAVEAGERLGFLPGTLHEKIDPYLKPLWDALHDMMEADELAAHVERGTIEVAPLAYMRGRAQPVGTPVLTPDGFRPIGELEVGDLVVGSDGRPTPVLGVYPQGRKEVFRLSARDGASTLCCAEHLWQVRTPHDRRIGRPGRVVETRRMRGRLRTVHRPRFELPLVAPVHLPVRDVPMDPYALGLLLGDGGVTTATTPSSPRAAPEPTGALGAAPGGVEVEHRSQLGLAATGSDTRFVPRDYLYNAIEVRAAVLQGLLDSDDGAVAPEGRTCRIEYTTCSDRLRDDVVFLVRSLGGVVYRRTRQGAGRRPGSPSGRDLPHGSDAHILEIRLPEGIEPFRRTRKREMFEQNGFVRPRRFVESIEPAGHAETVCIQVAAADALYVTEDFLVTHNTLNDAFIVADEAQNTTAEQMKMFLTRIGFGSKAVVTGDISQVDLPTGKRSGLRVVRDILHDIDGVAFCTLASGDVVRHHIVQRIVEAYEAYEEDREETT